MGALAAAGCAWSARGDTLRWEMGVADWARLLHGIFCRHRWRAVVIARQAAGRNGRCALTGGFLVCCNKHKIHAYMYIHTQK